MPQQLTRKGILLEVCTCFCGTRSAALIIPASQVLLHLLLQIIPVAAVEALLPECQGSPSVNWPFFSLVLLFCILVRLLLLRWYRSQIPNFLVLERKKTHCLSFTKFLIIYINLFILKIKIKRSKKFDHFSIIWWPKYVFLRISDSYFPCLFSHAMEERMFSG